MHEANIKQLAYTTELLQYFNGSTAIVQSAKTFGATGIGSGFTADDIIYVSGAGNADSNGTKTIGTVASALLTLDEALGANETATLTINQEWQSPWYSIRNFAKLIGAVYCSGNALLFVDYSQDKSNVLYQPNSSGEAITGATRFAFSYETVGPFARFRLRNNGADQSYMYAWFGGRFTS